MSRLCPLFSLFIVFTATSCTEPEEATPTAPSGTCDDFTRIDEGMVDPLDLVSPSTGEETVFFTADPCAVWDPASDLWRVFFTFADFEAEANGGMAAGIFGGTYVEGGEFSPYSELALPQLGTFDTSSVETCEAIRLDDPTSETGQRFYLFTGGSSAEEANYTMTLATSVDGEHFDYLPTQDSPMGQEGALFKIDAVLEGTTDQPGNFVTDPTIAVVDGTWHMWTLCIQQYPENFGGICYSTSTNAVDWEHHGLVSGLTRAFSIQPTVYYNDRDDRFEMYVVMDTVEEEGQIHDFETNLTLRVTGFYFATSEDGMTWTYDPEQAFCEDLSRPFENAGLATGADAELKDGEVFFFYPSFTTNGQGERLGNLLNWPLNLATRPL